MNKVIMFSILVLFFGCCPEPDSDQVKSDFARYRSDLKLISVKNTECSPPCFYWTIECEKRELDTTLIVKEFWQYCCSDIFGGEQVIKAKREGEFEYNIVTIR